MNLKAKLSKLQDKEHDLLESYLDIIKYGVKKAGSIWYLSKALGCNQRTIDHPLRMPTIKNTSIVARMVVEHYEP